MSGSIRGYNLYRDTLNILATKPNIAKCVYSEEVCLDLHECSPPVLPYQTHNSVMIEDCIRIESGSLGSGLFSPIKCFSSEHSN